VNFCGARTGVFGFRTGTFRAETVFLTGSTT
jgi:hypothetical protein